MSDSLLSEIKKLHKEEKDSIAKRLLEFVHVFEKGTAERLFGELSFCLLTPQSKAKNCWRAIENLTKKGLLLKGTPDEISKEIKGFARFHNNKAKYIVEARTLLSKNGKIDVKSKIKEFKDIKELREWLVKNIKGMGYKEAGHFLRNIGFGKEITILDRHILRNLKALGVIKELPKTITTKSYLEIEKKMIAFAKKIGIPLDHLDIVFWRKETGEIFK